MSRLRREIERVNIYEIHCKTIVFQNWHETEENAFLFCLVQKHFLNNN